MNLKHAIQQYATLALDGVQKPFPYHLSHVFRKKHSLASPSEIHPAFHGCFDWHSAVHGHWLLALAVDACRQTDFSSRCADALVENLTESSLQSETDCLISNKSFERPYGLAWILMLGIEVDRSPEPHVRALASLLAPLMGVAFGNIRDWLPKLSHPVRTGTHNQTAFSLRLSLDWARHFDNHDARTFLESNARRLFQHDHDLPMHIEPSGEDFLSPALSEAWLMSDVLDGDAFVDWFERAFPDPAVICDLRPLVPTDRTDGRLVHLDGLNLSRSWMLGALARKLGREHASFIDLRAAALSHGRSGLEAALSTEYMASHWLGTFAAFLLKEMDGFLEWDDFFADA